MSYQIDGAVVKEQDITFAIVVVKPHIIKSSVETQAARDAYRHIFPGMPIILMGENAEGKPAYYGRKDIVKFLAKVDPHRIPWKRYIIT
ncbi:MULTISPECIES: hypothetical protein [Desulfosporosinus]|uniref:Uncharacterized protein n=1 Tax=Desulfosporosinus nitroreducens TaxID=2018668 RepID=A0ABT8QQ48_9FIRM|nr:MULTISPECIES: hypothetical protein [Desulfosporosinus]MDA8223145.1 hypothetical protein [Desulfitobacterium hafniense]MCB8818715.1 hypothetical protein [Desulfosporosinus sp. SRJS8]MCO1601924.1 hypothetical protein [Desulfosporosinus nitroreducens]MCO5387659.1 hypothetical protein [Desulfosporosinus sp.]MDO0823479.1 hypothetical protein [Desulfosporosinus nitroreducens]